MKIDSTLRLPAVSQDGREEVGRRKAKGDFLYFRLPTSNFPNKAPWEDAGNQTFGTDLRFNPKEGVSIFGSLAKTWTDGLHDKDLAGKISGYWETESSEIGGSCSDIQENFNPEMGFVSRKDVRNGDLWGHKSFKIRKGIFRSVGGGGHYGVGLNHDRHLEDRHLGMHSGSG